MKKIFTKPKYKKWKNTAAEKRKKSINRRKKKKILYLLKFKKTNKWKGQVTIQAPKDFRFVENPKESFKFFKSIRNNNNHYFFNNKYFVRIDLSEIQDIDYCSVSALKALLLDLKDQNIYIQGNSPIKESCHIFLKNSGFYDGLLNHKNSIIHEKGKSDRVYFTKGQGVLSYSEDLKLTGLFKKIRKHLTMTDGHCPQLRTISLEICGNSIEHSLSLKRRWMVGVKYEDDNVIITLTDTGKGILKTLYRRLGKKFTDFISKNDIEILEGAFDKKYESRTLDVNRNKGLPVIKQRFIDGYIKNLVVITNNVVLNFANKQKSFMSDKESFNGTIFKLELDKSCFKN